MAALPTLILLFALALGAPLPRASGALPPDINRIVFLGDSITYSGEYIDWVETYLRIYEPDLTADCLNLGLPSETVSGLSEPGHAGGAFPRPALPERLSRALERAKPDLVIACYGMNDGIYHPFSEERFQAFRSGIETLRAQCANAGIHVIHLTPPVFDPVPISNQTLPAGLPEYRQPFEGYDGVLQRYSEWLLAQRTNGWTVIDIHGPMREFLDARRRENPAFRFSNDGVHANDQGHWLIARELLRWLGAPDRLTRADSPDALLAAHPGAAEAHAEIRRRQRLLRDAWLARVQHLRPGVPEGKPFDTALEEAAAADARVKELVRNPFPGRRSEWFGFDRYDFMVQGLSALVVAPGREAPGRPWVWHGEFFGHKPAPDISLLERGFHIVYLRVPDMLGSPRAVKLWDILYEELTARHGFAPKAALVGLSRGGLYCYNWAIAHPDRVACIYADAPVCDFKSWPGGMGKGPGSPRDWALVLQQYGFASEAEAMAYRGNPVDNLAPLASAGVPLLHVYGDADEVVPWEENTGLVAQRYKALGGSITLIAKPGVGHHPHGLEDPTPIVEFIRRHAEAQFSPPIGAPSSSPE